MAGSANAADGENNSDTDSRDAAYGGGWSDGGQNGNASSSEEISPNPAPAPRSHVEVTPLDPPVPNQSTTQETPRSPVVTDETAIEIGKVTEVDEMDRVVREQTTIGLKGLVATPDSQMTKDDNVIGPSKYGDYPSNFDFSDTPVVRLLF